jgi:hypothetical protein
MTDKPASVKIGERTFVLTPMRISERKRMTQMALEVKDLAGKGQLDLQAAEKLSELMTSMIHASIRRSNQDITREEIEDALSDEELARIFNTLCAISAPATFPPSGGSWLKN